MDHFSIRDIGNLCGIKTHTLRIWEQRYQFFIPNRKSGNHRIYNSEDLKNLLRVAFLYNSGYKISHLARMNQEEIDCLVAGFEPPPGDFGSYIFQLVEASVSFDEMAFRSVVQRILRRYELKPCIEKVFYPFLERIGLLWLSNHVVPAQEHFSSQLISQIIIQETDKLESPGTGPAQVLIFGFSGEFHEIPLLVTQYYLVSEGVKVIQAGTNVSQQIIDTIYQKHPVPWIYSHLVTRLPYDQVRSMVNHICVSYPKTKLVISGPAACCIEKRHANLVILESFQEMVNFTRMVSGLHNSLHLLQ